MKITIRCRCGAEFAGECDDHWTSPLTNESEAFRKAHAGCVNADGLAQVEALERAGEARA
jgi:hypothetical protein